MKKKAYKRARKRFQAVFEEWATRLGLMWWHLECVFMEDTPADFVVDDGHQVAVTVEAKWEYMEALFTINTPVVAEMSDESLERLVVHELCHVLVNEMRCKSSKHEERVCSTLTKAFMWVKEGV